MRTDAYAAAGDRAHLVWEREVHEPTQQHRPAAAAASAALQPAQSEADADRSRRGAAGCLSAVPAAATAARTEHEEPAAVALSGDRSAPVLPASAGFGPDYRAQPPDFESAGAGGAVRVPQTAGRRRVVVGGRMAGWRRRRLDGVAVAGLRVRVADIHLPAGRPSVPRQRARLGAGSAAGALGRAQRESDSARAGRRSIQASLVRLAHTPAVQSDKHALTHAHPPTHPPTLEHACMDAKLNVPHCTARQPYPRQHKSQSMPWVSNPSIPRCQCSCTYVASAVTSGEGGRGPHPPGSCPAVRPALRSRGRCWRRRPRRGCSPRAPPSARSAPSRALAAPE